MECHEVRAVLSARLDGEPVPADTDDDVVDAHLDSCPDCREWYGRAGDIGRVLRLAPVPDTPRPLVLPGLTGDDGPTGDAASAPPPASDLAGQLLAAGGVAGVGRGRALSVALSRVLLGVLALVYLAWGVVLLAGPISGAGAVPGEGAAPVGGAVA
ncbi:zf-HC2 domain-containing protein, partial [Corynebacterium bovis]